VNPLQHVKYLSLIDPAAIVDDTDFSTNEIDTKGYDYATIIFQYGTSDIAMVELTVTESDSSGSGHEDVTGLIVGTSDNIDGDTSSLPSATDDDELVVFEIDLRGRKRYLDLVATAGDGSSGTYASAVCILSKANVVPLSVSDRGCLELLRV
jgi:hypothetical protein